MGMAKQPFFQVQRAIFEALTGNAEIMAYVGFVDGQPQVYDSPPENARFPYILIGEDSFSRQDWYHVAEPTVQGFTKQNGRMSEVKKLASMIQDALDIEIAVDGFTTTEWSYEETDFWRDADQGSEMCDCSFRYVLDPDESQ